MGEPGSLVWLVGVVEAAGHSQCGAWQYDEHTDRLWCACEARLYKSALAAVS